MVWLNSHNVRDLRTPFGGVKASGLGHEGGYRSLDFYSHRAGRARLLGPSTRPVSEPDHDRPSAPLEPVEGQTATFPPTSCAAAYVELVVTDLAAAARVLRRPARPGVTEEDEDALYLRTFEEFIHHNLVLRTGPVPAAAAIAYRVPPAEDVDAAEAYYRALGCRVPSARRTASPTAWATRSGCMTRSASRTSSSTTVEHVERLTQRYDLHRAGALVRLDHFNQVTPDVPAAAATTWRTSASGCPRTSRMTEGVTYAAWMHRKPTVHDVALTGGDGPRLHHLAFATHEQHHILADLRPARRPAHLRRDRARPRPPRRVQRVLPLHPDPDGHRVEIYTQDYYTGDPDNPVVTWDVHDNQRRDWWGNPGRAEPGTPRPRLVLDLDGNPQPVIDREPSRPRMAVTVGADGFSYTRPDDQRDFKLGHQL